ncbi:unnamed protein product [Parnassius mnemosyne]|uniref:Uncharacterized protein n=1 Tax=Parnassius mnemosyne TaxID=213953 RepID=A0AAV1K7R8_9NEOP
MENVTMRRRKRTFSDDPENFQISQSLTNSTLLDVTSQSEYLIHAINKSSVDELNLQLSSVRTELESAHNEIAELNSQIQLMELKLQEKDRTINCLKKLSDDKITCTPIAKRTPIPLSKKIIYLQTKTPRISPLHASEIVCKKLSYINPSDTNHGTENVTRDKEPPNCVHEEKERKNLNKINNTSSTPKIIILGDQQVRGLAQEMCKQRSKNKWNNVYSVSGICKPNASSAQIFNSIDNILETLNIDDIVILGVGNNDKNPYVFLTELCSTLCKLKKNKVFVVNVFNNDFLNVKLLNREIKLFVQNFSNCYFIDISNNLNRNSRSIPKHFLCSKLNIEIDNFNYEKLVRSLLRSKCAGIATGSTGVNKLNMKELSEIKGTIPYYFYRQIDKSKVEYKQNPMNNGNDSTFFR